jgi:hypothetical protein
MHAAPTQIKFKSKAEVNHLKNPSHEYQRECIKVNPALQKKDTTVEKIMSSKEAGAHFHNTQNEIDMQLSP